MPNGSDDASREVGPLNEGLQLRVEGAVPRDPVAPGDDDCVVGLGTHVDNGHRSLKGLLRLNCNTDS
jgi:hypothetical protein